MPDNLSEDDAMGESSPEEHVTEVATSDEDGDSSLTIDNAENEERDKFLESLKVTDDTSDDEELDEDELDEDLLDDAEEGEEEEAEAEPEKPADGEPNLDDIDVQEEGVSTVTFDASKDSLPKKVWAKVPKEAQKYIKDARTHSRQQESDLKKLTPLADYASDLLTNGQKAGLEIEHISAWMTTLYKANTGDAPSIKAMGDQLIKYGYTPPSAEVDMTDFNEYIEDLMDDGDLTERQVKKLKSKIKTKPGKVEEAPPTQKQQSRNDSVDTRLEAEKTEATAKANAIAAKFEAHYGNDWPAIEKRALTAMTAEHATNPLASYVDWPGRYLKNLKLASKEVIQAKKQMRKRRRLNQGESTAGRKLAGKRTKGAPVSEEQAFMDKYTK